jgi:hypothetical protein
MKTAIFEAAKKTRGIVLVIKPHTQENVGQTRALVGDAENIIFAERDSDIRHLIMTCDAFISFGSTATIDALIAGGGVLSRRRRGPLTIEQETKKAQGLRTLLLVNAAADVGYVLGGLFMNARGRKGLKTLRMGAGDGAAIVVQGAFLLVLDVTQARRLG